MSKLIFTSTLARPFEIEQKKKTIKEVEPIPKTLYLIPIFVGIESNIMRIDSLNIFTFIRISSGSCEIDFVIFHTSW